MKLHLGDTVVVTAGKYKTKTGKVTRVSEKTGKVVVEKVNIRTKHIKKKQGQPGQRIQFEAPMDVSKVSVVCPHCKKSTRVGYIMITTGDKTRKQRVCKKCNQSLDKVMDSKKSTQK